MYTFSNKLKTFSIALMILGLLGVGYGFMTSHKSFEEVETLLAQEESGHGGGHAEEATTHDGGAETNTHAEDTHAETTDAHHDDAHAEHVEHVQHQIANRP